MKDQERKWADLMRSSLAGDSESYRLLLEALAQPLRIVIRGASSRYQVSASDTEDILQETLLAIHLKRHTWKQTEPLGPWVRAIARNKLIDALRRRGHRVHLPLEDWIETLEAPEPEKSLSNVDAEKLLSVVNGRQRDVVRAIAIEGLSAKEAATRFGISEGAVRVALHRGLNTIAAAFREDGL
jgi:RNA polymerase sigma-70 factor (ECF subfamily)